MNSAAGALQWMKRMLNGDRVLFRGQNRIWPTIKPSIVRDAPETMAAVWTVCRRFHSAASGITGYSIPNEHDRLAILQHYVGRSPVIDLTGTPEVALYFALLGAEPGRICVVYAIDRTACASSSVVFSDHSFLVLPFENRGTHHRWLRQDGYSVGPLAWRDVDAVQSFDLLHLPGVQSYDFIRSADDDRLVQELGDLEDVSIDPLASAVRGVVSSIARSLGVMTPGMQSILMNSKTVDAEAELIAEIEGMIARVSGMKAAETLIPTLHILRSAVGTHWETSFDATLEWARAEMRRLDNKED